MTDKVKHIGISAGMALVLCVVLRLAEESLWMTFYAALMSMIIGVMKELYDAWHSYFSSNAIMPRMFFETEFGIICTDWGTSEDDITYID